MQYRHYRRRRHGLRHLALNISRAQAGRVNVHVLQHLSYRLRAPRLPIQLLLPAVSSAARDAHPCLPVSKACHSTSFALLLVNGVFIGLALLPVLLSLVGPTDTGEFSAEAFWNSIKSMICGSPDLRATLSGIRSVISRVSSQVVLATPQPEVELGTRTSPSNHMQSVEESQADDDSADVHARIAKQLEEAHEQGKRIRWRVQAPIVLPCVFFVTLQDVSRWYCCVRRLSLLSLTRLLPIGTSVAKKETRLGKTCYRRWRKLPSWA